MSSERKPAVDVSITVVNFNVKHFADQCLRSIYASKGDIDFEVFLVDNASNDGSPEYLQARHPDVNYIINRENLGFGRANNQAMERATGRYLLILNPDTILGETSLEAMVEYMDSHPEAGAMGPMILTRDGGFDVASKRGFPTPWVAFTRLSGLANLFPKSRIFGRYNLLYLDPNKPCEVDALVGSCMMVRREVYLQVGGFDEDYFMYHEDVDLGWLTHLAGYKIMVVPRAVVYHKYSFSRNKKKFFWMERNRFWVILKNYKTGTLILIFPAFIFMEIGLIFYSLVSGWFIWKIKSYFSALSGLNKVLEKRKKVQRERVVGDREFSRYLTGVVKFEDINNPVLSLANIFFNLYWKITKQLIFW